MVDAADEQFELVRDDFSSLPILSPDLHLAMFLNLPRELNCMPTLCYDREIVVLARLKGRNLKALVLAGTASFAALTGYTLAHDYVGRAQPGLPIISSSLSISDS